jgi:hypothetical protein
LSRFNFTLHHKPGQSMDKPDTLSRQADHGSGQGDNDNLTLIAPELFRIHTLAGMRLECDERNIPFSAVSRTTSKRNQWRRQLGSFGRIRAEAQSRAQSGRKVMNYYKGTSVCFLTPPILSHLLSVHRYSPSSPLYSLQGLYL